MPKLAFIFPGQGAQYVGMGKNLYDNFRIAREMYEEANDILGMDIAKLSFEGPEKELKKTLNTQPAILVHSAIVMKMLKIDDIFPQVVAGHSLGEFTANVAAKSMTFQDAVATVRLRGELMYKSGIKVPGTMAAIIGLDEETLEEICNEVFKVGICQLANFNSRQQIVISGEINAVQKAVELAKAKGAKRAIELPVSGAFHSDLMRTACPGLTKKLEEIELTDANVPIIANASARPVTDADEIREVLVAQLNNPVRWVQSMEKMKEMGVETMIECGPGKVLKGLMRRIDKSITVHNVEDAQSMERTFHSIK